MTDVTPSFRFTNESKLKSLCYCDDCANYCREYAKYLPTKNTRLINSIALIHSPNDDVYI